MGAGGRNEVRDGGRVTMVGVRAAQVTTEMIPEFLLLCPHDSVTLQDSRHWKCPEGSDKCRHLKEKIQGKVMAVMKRKED